MKLLFYFGHPAQYLFLRETIVYKLTNEKNKLSGECKIAHWKLE